MIEIDTHKLQRFHVETYQSCSTYKVFLFPVRNACFLSFCRHRNLRVVEKVGKEGAWLESSGDGWACFRLPRAFYFSALTSFNIFWWKVSFGNIPNVFSMRKVELFAQSIERRSIVFQSSVEICCCKVFERLSISLWSLWSRTVSLWTANRSKWTEAIWLHAR